MSTKHLVDSEIREFCESFPIHDFADDIMPALREGMASMLGEIGTPPETVIREKITMPGYNGAPDVGGYLYKPRQPKNNAPAYLHIHGGGMIVGAPEHTDERCTRICDTFGITVLSTSYRLAPERGKRRRGACGKPCHFCTRSRRVSYLPSTACIPND